jgi:hypothetical protein
MRALPPDPGLGPELSFATRGELTAAAPRRTRLPTVARVLIPALRPTG